MPGISLKPEENDPPRSVRITRCAAICGTEGDGGLACSTAEGTDCGAARTPRRPARATCAQCKFTRRREEKKTRTSRRHDTNFPADITAEVDGLTTARYTPVKGVIIAGVLCARRAGACAGASSLRLLHHSCDHACCRGGQVATPTMAAAVFAVGAAQLAESSHRCFAALHAGPRPS